jgi:hypothetical protein
VAVEPLLEALATVSEILRNLRLELRQSELVSRVAHAIDVQRLRGGELYIEGYVDAELTSSNGVVWWLEATGSGGSWSIEPEVRVQRGDRQERLLSLSTQTVSSEQLPEGLVEAARRLAATLSEVDLASV